MFLRAWIARSVQPRVCGERDDHIAQLAKGGGSAPRVRGTGHHRKQGRRRVRFSPACAGNGANGPERRGFLAVQPRVCGERLDSVAKLAMLSGSAPRVRGTGWQEQAMAQRVRFSPACAGNGCCGQASSRRAPVQPRVCGERGARTMPARVTDGSAPRVRGTASPVTANPAARRFSPACAGNGDRARSHPLDAAVQPRVCGERHAIGKKHVPACGSAPRVRGTDFLKSFSLSNGFTMSKNLPADSWFVRSMAGLFEKPSTREAVASVR